MKKKIAMIRTPGGNQCPFGLPISVACKNAGESVNRMQELAEAPEEQRERYQRANRKAYRHHQEGKRCIYADKIVEGKDAVNCDYGDYGQGMRDHPIRPSPFYPRVFNGMAQTGLWIYPVGSYWDNSEAQQLFSGIFSIYASSGEINIQKHSSFEPDENLVRMYYEVEGNLTLEDNHGNL